MTIKEKGYQVIRGLVDPDLCKDLTEKLWKLKELNYFTFDTQCPISYSFYGILDPLLNEHRETFSETIGIDLLPAYSYTRIYRVGEILTEHTDREACEYSVTLCLGMSDEDNPWPIFMGKDKLLLNPGDACIYKGCEIPHSRERFEEEWQAQTFLHYVDANGPYRDHSFDGREHLGEIKEEPSPYVVEQNNIKESYDDGFFQDYA